MCGIYGFINKESTATEKILDIFIDLGIETESRGTHATGYYGINSSGSHLRKAPLKASEFFLKNMHYNTFYGDLPSILIGHNRFATAGKPEINKNNHPFSTDRFGFMHNGVTKGWVNFKDLDITVETECDSEWIFRYLLKTLEIHHGNMFSAIKKTLNVFDQASVACSVVDSKQKKLWLFRNIGNPICYTKLESLNCIFFASTPYILKESLEAQGISDPKIIELEAGEIICIDENLQITSEQTCNLRGPRSSFTSAASYFNKPKTTYAPKVKRKNTDGTTGYKCLKCGKKFVSIKYVEDHLIEYHNILDKLDGEEIEDYWEDLSAPRIFSPSKSWIKKSNGEIKVINRKQDFHSTQLCLPFPTVKPKAKIYSSFEEMNRDTNLILKQMEKITAE